MTIFLPLSWIATIIAIFFYSFTQIDLGLTLTRVSWWQVVQRQFQSIGYFNRPLSTAICLIIVLILYSLYFTFLHLLVRKKPKFTAKHLWWLTVLTAVVLLFSYNAFSYDLFNYIFDAKIFTFYGKNPYQYKALDFPGDPMLGFMHWTHRTYPYAPVWLALTVPLSFLGFGKLLPTMILFKGLAAASYLGMAWFIFKILGRIDSKRALLGLAVFALSPFVVVEGLVSAHNDMVMMALALGGFWLLVEKRYFWAWAMLFLSIGIKFATGFLLPVFLWVSFQKWQKREIDWEKVWLFSFFLMLGAVMAVVGRDELKPWYLLYLLPFVALLPGKKWLFWPVTTLSLGLLLHYAPFLYLGNWNPPVPVIKLGLTLFSLMIGISIVFLNKVCKQKI